MMRNKFSGAGVALLVMAFASAVAADDILSPDEKAGIDAFNQGDIVGSMMFFERAADAGSALAKTRLAWILDGANDDVRAVELYRAAAEQGYGPGMHGLGEMYSKGEGVAKDSDKALIWFTRAADAGYDKALRLLIGAYEKGEFGLTPNEDMVRAYREKLDKLSDAPTKSNGE